MVTSFEDYTEDDRWDWDRQDPNQYCRHGRFIGSWWGPDILCVDCEMGDDPSLNDMIRSYERDIEKVLDKNMAVVEFVSALDLSKAPDSVREYVADKYFIFTKEQNEKNKYSKDRIQELIDEYEQFCDPELGRNDTSVLYKKWVHEKNEYRKLSQNESA